MNTPATLILEFGEGVDPSSALVKKEFDPVRNVDAEGNPKTSFVIDVDKLIYFLVHLEAGLVIEWIRPTNGSVAYLGFVKQIREEQCSFSFADDARYKDLTYIPCNTPDTFFYGNTPTLLPIRGRRLTVDGDNGLPGVGDVSYKVEFHSFCFHAPPKVEIREGKTAYPIEIRIKIGVAP